MCSHATVTDSDLLSLIGTYDWDLYFYLLGCSTHQNLMSCSRILNSIKGFKLNQLQRSNITKEKKSTALRKRAAHPTSLTLPLEEPPLKRIKSEPEATSLNNCMQSTSDSSTIVRPDGSEKTSSSCSSPYFGS